MNAPLEVIVAEIAGMRDTVNATINSLDDRDSGRGFLGNWFASIPERLIGMRWCHEAFPDDGVEPPPRRFVDLATGRVSYGLPSWYALDRLRLLPELRGLTGNRARFAKWCLDGFDETRKIEDVSIKDVGLVRDLFRRIEDATEGTGDDVCQEAAFARQMAEDRHNELLDEQDEALRSLEFRMPPMNGLYQPSYKTSL